MYYSICTALISPYVSSFTSGTVVRHSYDGRFPGQNKSVPTRVHNESLRLTKRYVTHQAITGTIYRFLLKKKRLF